MTATVPAPIATVPAPIMPAPIMSVLVANRGEIARRVHHTARLRGLTTVSVYSDADEHSPHVRESDAAVRLPGVTPAETYLRGDLIIEAALSAGADAIHPGYGFLSENAAFACAVREAGLTWIGPPPEAMEAMASKVEAKKQMAAAGVPILEQLDPDALKDEMFPVLVKASFGGGGRGMRVVRSPHDLDQEIASARREAASAFGEEQVFCERYLEHGRHIEVQIMADEHGTVWAVGERECSIQRRHQKVIEEAPSPLVESTEGMRSALFSAARKAAAAIGYTGAGTVEFLATDSGEFYFLEMNTRLQVEHPVTEATTGLDLVGLQFDVAQGVPLPSEEPPATQGWAVEARLYAEDPAHGDRPCSGTLWALEIPGVISQFEGPFRPGLRLDSGVEPGFGGAEIAVHYDPMLAKVISFAPTRHQACTALSGALARARIHGVTTNRDYLVRILRHSSFLAGNITTHFLSEHAADQLTTPLATEEAVAISALAAALVDGAAEHSASPVSAAPAGFRCFGHSTQRRTFRRKNTEDEVVVAFSRSRSGIAVELSPDLSIDDVAVIDVRSTAADIEVSGVRHTFAVARYPANDGTAVVEVDSSLGPVSLLDPPRFPDPIATIAAGSLLAPMPGVVVRIAASVGDQVSAGQPLLWMEAMKMEHTLTAGADGVLVELPVTEGDQVEAGAILAVVDEHPPEKP